MMANLSRSQIKRLSENHTLRHQQDSPRRNHCGSEANVYKLQYLSYTLLSNPLILVGCGKIFGFQMCDVLIDIHDRCEFIS